MKIISGMKWKQGDDWGGWFRVFGYGISVSTLTPMFSERIGARKCIKILGVKISLLGRQH